MLESVPAASSGPPSLRTRLLAIPEDELVPPHVDPSTAALVALGVVDFVRHDGKKRFDELAAVGGVEPQAFDELEKLAEALLRVVAVFEAAPRAPAPVVIPQDLDVAARERRGAVQHTLESHVDPVITRALALQRLSYGPIDLAIDLRAGAALLARTGSEKALADEACALAAKLEHHLWTHDTSELREARKALHRVWSAFEPAYHALAELGRELFTHAEGVFPTLEAIADLERHARHESSSAMPAAAIVESELPPISHRSAPPSRRSGPWSMRVRPSHGAHDTARKLVEVDLHAESESNVWLGFSQDIAEGGVFVASYVHHPIGAELDLDLHLHGNDEPIRVAGEVTWLRPHGAGDDMPAGFGVRLTQASKEATQALTRLANARTPIFYDD